MKTSELKRALSYRVPQVRLAMIREGGKEDIVVHGPSDLEMLVEPLRHYAEEHFVCFHLDAKNKVCGFQIVSHGTVSTSLVHPREVFKGAILSNAVSIIVAHNHPAGSLIASPDDLETTEKLVAVGKLIGIPVVDHVIVAQKGMVSLREKHKAIFE